MGCCFILKHFNINPILRIIIRHLNNHINMDINQCQRLIYCGNGINESVKTLHPEIKSAAK
jgi:hypothetical protein